MRRISKILLMAMVLGSCGLSSSDVLAEIHFDDRVFIQGQGSSARACVRDIRREVDRFKSIYKSRCDGAFRAHQGSGPTWSSASTSSCYTYVEYTCADSRDEFPWKPPASPDRMSMHVVVNESDPDRCRQKLIGQLSNWKRELGCSRVIEPFDWTFYSTSRPYCAGDEAVSCQL